MKNLLLLTLFLIPGFSICQPDKDSKRDHVWILGSDLNASSSFGGTEIDFSADPPAISFVNKPFDHYVTNASMCDSEGNLLFYTNGLEIADKKHQIMSNSQGFYSGPWLEGLGLPICQGSLILPFPQKDSICVLIHPLLKFAEPLGPVSIKMQYSLIDMSKDGGFGEAVLLNQPIVNDTLENGQLTACRHANGRDWWILVPELVTNRYYRLLLDPTGLRLMGEQRIGGVLGTYLTQVAS